MRITNVRIKNFRGIQDLEIELGEVTVLIGENNTGKTSVLDALKLCLHDLAPQHRDVVDGLDFRLAESGSEPYSADPIEIELVFSDRIGDKWNESLARDLARFGMVRVDDLGHRNVRMQIRCEYDRNARGFNTEWLFFNQYGDPSPPDDRQIMLLKRGIQYYYLNALRDAAHHFDAQGPFWKPFLRDSQLSLERKTEIEMSLREVNKIIVSSHTSFEQVCDGLERIQSVIPLGSDESVSIEAVPGRIFDLLDKVQVQLTTGTGAKIPLDRHGDGTQSLAVLMLFSSFVQVHTGGSSFLALEEPEAHLHPSATRVLWQLIRKLTGQKLISTHSGDFLAEIDIHDIRRLVRTDSGIKAFHVPRDLLSPEEIRKFNYHIRRARGELLFARCWLLVEGESEGWVYPAAARALGWDFHQESVCVVEFRQSDVGMLIKIANAFGILWYCVGDDDANREQEEKKLKKNLSGTDETDRFVFPYENLEEYLKGNGYANVYQQYSGKYKKTEAAATVAQEMRDRGQSGVPQEIRSIIEKTVSRAKRGWQ